MPLFSGYARGFGGGGGTTATPTPDPITIKPVVGEAPSILKQAVEQYRPGGAFATARAEQLRGRERVVTAGMEAGMVGRGLAGTTVGAAIPAVVEQQVSAPWRTQTEMMRGARLMEAVLAQAGFTERQTAREQEVAIANAQMELQQRLANQQISVQEYNAATARLSARGGAGGGAISTIGRGAADIPRVYVPGLGMTTAGGPRDPSTYAGGGGGDAGYGGRLLESLDAGGGEDWTKFPAGGGEPYQTPAPGDGGYGGVLPGVVGGEGGRPLFGKSPYAGVTMSPEERRALRIRQRAAWA